MLRWSRLKPSCTWPLVWLASTLLIAGAGSQLQKQSVQPFAADQLTRLPGEHTLVMQLRISAEASRKILEHLRSNPELEGDVFLRGSGLRRVLSKRRGEQWGSRQSRVIQTRCCGVSIQPLCSARWPPATIGSC